MAVPKAPVYKHGDPVTRQRNVRPAGKVLSMQAVSKPVGKQNPTDFHLGLRVPVGDAGHVPAALNGWDAVHPAGNTAPSGADKGAAAALEPELIALAEWHFDGGESYCAACPSRCAGCPYDEHEPVTQEGLLARCQGSGRPEDLPVPEQAASMRARGLRPRRAGAALAMTRLPVLPSAFLHSVGTLDRKLFAAQSSARMLPCQRFADALASACA